MKLSIVLQVTALCCVLALSAAERAPCQAHGDCSTNEHCRFSYDDSNKLVHGFCFSSDSATQAEIDRMSYPETSFLELQSGMAEEAPPKDNKANSIALTLNAGNGQPTAIIYNAGGYVYTFGTAVDNSLQLTQGPNTVLTVETLTNTVTAVTRKFGAGSITNYGAFDIAGVPQWRQVVAEEFQNNNAQGWSNQTTTTCKGITMLGGFGAFSQGQVFKTFTNLTKHTQLRIVANYHFIDNWMGESGFVKINNGAGGSLQFIWTDRANRQQCSACVDVCGSPNTPEVKFTSNIDVVVAHSDSSLQMVVGSTLSKPSTDASFGISGLAIYAR